MSLGPLILLLLDFGLPYSLESHRVAHLDFVVDKTSHTAIFTHRETSRICLRASKAVKQVLGFYVRIKGM